MVRNTNQTPFTRGNRSEHHNTDLKGWRPVIGQNE
jgi:hypothetical protein